MYLKTVPSGCGRAIVYSDLGHLGALGDSWVPHTIPGITVHGPRQEPLCLSPFDNDSRVVWVIDRAWACGAGRPGILPALHLYTNYLTSLSLSLPIKIGTLLPSL